MELPRRKNLRLPNYDYASNGAYYVTICTQDQLHLFGRVNPASQSIVYNEAGKMVLRWLSKIEEKYSGVCLDCSVVMPNHIHLILFLEDATNSLSDILKWFKSQTTNEYIRGVKAGKYPPFQNRIWQRNYFERIIHSENQWNEVRQYITYNTAKWCSVRE